MAGVLTSGELLVIVNPASFSALSGWAISQTAVRPATICRGWQRSARDREGVDGGGATDTVILRDFVTEQKLAETIDHPVMPGDVVKGNVALMEPAGTVTEAGRLNPVLVEVKVMTDGPAAGAVKATVHVPPRPGDTAVGEQTRRAREDVSGERTIGKDNISDPT